MTCNIYIYIYIGVAGINGLARSKDINVTFIFAVNKLKRNVLDNFLVMINNDRDTVVC